MPRLWNLGAGAVRQFLSFPGSVCWTPLEVGSPIRVDGTIGDATPIGSPNGKCVERLRRETRHGTTLPLIHPGIKTLPSRQGKGQTASIRRKVKCLVQAGFF